MSTTPSEPSVAGDRTNAVGEAFRSAMVAVRRLRGRDTQRRGELSYAQASLLFALDEHGELCATDVAALADVAPSTATAMLDRLVECGFVERVRSSHDRRVVLVALTARGAEIVASRRAQYRRLWNWALDEFSAEQLAGATAVLERVAAMFEQIAAEGSADESRDGPPQGDADAPRAGERATR